MSNRDAMNELIQSADAETKAIMTLSMAGVFDEKETGVVGIEQIKRAIGLVNDRTNGENPLKLAILVLLRGSLVTIERVAELWPTLDNAYEVALTKLGVTHEEVAGLAKEKASAESPGSEAFKFA